MTEQEEKVMKSHKSLLSKYGIPLEHLSFEYVEKCNDKKEMEKIVKILRSGEEGHYTKLIECAESRLMQIAPDSRVLRSEEPALTKSMLDTEQWKTISNDLEKWTGEMKTRDENLKDSSNVCQRTPELPAVRKTKCSNSEQSLDDKQVAGPSKLKTVLPCNYSDWDKYDVEKELLKMEVEEERKKEQAIKKKRLEEKEKKKSKIEEKDEVVRAAGNLSAAEKEFMATQEKDRGNDYYRSGDYEKALKHYTSSILLCPTPTVYNNRAMAQLKLKRYRGVLADCNQVLEGEPCNVKALLRRGIANQNRNNCEQAFEDFSRAVELEPDNQWAKSLADQMKVKCRTVRMTIEDEPKGFAFPQPRSNIAVNEWGLAKVMCRCSGIPAWSQRIPPKCKICERKRLERRILRQEERRSAQISLESTDMNEGDSGIVVSVTPPDDDGGNEVADRSENDDQMQSDEKGSGDMKATEKLVQQVILETNHEKDSEELDPEDLLVHEPKSVKESGDTKEISGSNQLKHKNDNVCTGSEHTVVEEKKGREVLEFDKKELKEPISEIKQEAPSIIYSSGVKERKGDTKKGRKGHKGLPESNKFKHERGKSSDGSSGKKQTKGSADVKTLSEENIVKETRQTATAATDSSDSKLAKVNVASKYKKNMKPEQEEVSEQTLPRDVQNMNTTMSPYDFIKLWHTIKTDADLKAHARVLQAVPPADLSKVIGKELDGTMLSTILACLEKHFIPELVLEYLDNLVLVPRFQIVFLFLHPAEKQAVRQLLKKLESLGHSPSRAVQQAFPC